MFVSVTEQLTIVTVSSMFGDNIGVAHEIEITHVREGRIPNNFRVTRANEISHRAYD